MTEPIADCEGRLIASDTNVNRAIQKAYPDSCCFRPTRSKRRRDIDKGACQLGAAKMRNCQRVAAVPFVSLFGLRVFRRIRADDIRFATKLARKKEPSDPDALQESRPN